MKKIKWIIIIFLMVSGLILLFSNQIKYFFFQKEQKLMLESFEQGRDVDAEDSFWNQESEESIVEEVEQVSSVMKAILEIPSIDLKIGVFQGASRTNLNAGVATITPESRLGEGNYSLAGHRSFTDGKQFNRLGEVKKDDLIIVRDRAKEYTYQVKEIFVVHQSDVSVLEGTENSTITLVTCTPIGERNPPDRLIVKGVLKKIEPY